MLWSLAFAAAAFLVLGLLRQGSPCNPDQPRWFGRDMGVDVLWWLLSFVLYGNLTVILTRLVLQGLYGADGPRLFQAIQAGRGALSHLPVLVQAGLVIFLVDVIQYWLHRAFHTRWLWPFHAIHHSPRELDWTATWRIHPVNFVFYETVAGVLTLLLGCSPQALVIVVPFNFFSAAFVHANLNWTFGPFRYVLASPVFHRWHHASDPAIHDKNFAPTFPFLDVMFGTFHMPKGQLPDAYGAEGVPTDMLGQLAHPFVAIGQMLGRARAARASEAAARP
jgi:sterol desaturase/sphingolipid hydroxylase (fatty acid hydroxylase superfamily)